MHCRYPASIQVLEAQKKALVVMQQTLDPLSHLPGLKQGFKKNTSGKKKLKMYLYRDPKEIA